MGMFLFIVSFLAGIGFIIKLIIDIIKRNPKRLDIIGIVVCMVLFVTGAMIDSDGVETNQTNTNVNINKDKDKKQQLEDMTYDDLKENIIGKSDKDIRKITKSKPSKVLNDTTGKWKKLNIAESINIEEYAKSYADKYMKDGDVHFIVNFNYKTTTRLNKYGDMLYLTAMEYVDKEEHDAKKIGNGMILGEYTIYPDGDIEQIN